MLVEIGIWNETINLSKAAFIPQFYVPSDGYLVNLIWTRPAFACLYNKYLFVVICLSVICLFLICLCVVCLFAICLFFLDLDKWSLIYCTGSEGSQDLLVWLLVILLSCVCLFVCWLTSDKQQFFTGFWDASSRLPHPLDRSETSNCNWLSHLLIWHCPHLLYPQHGKILYRVLLCSYITWLCCIRMVAIYMKVLNCRLHFSNSREL